MLVVRFGLGDRAFGVRARDVREILPLCRTRPLPGVPDWVTGELLLAGSPVPVVDLRRWIDGVPARTDLATRMLLLDWRGRDGSAPVAFVVEGVRETVDVPAAAIGRRSAGEPGERVLGGSFVQDGTIIQLLDPKALLATELGAILYPDESA